MSVDETKLLFEGFLQKRKDTMKIRWSTYWFRLQNTTLFFYTKKNGNASHLRGYYYIYTVQSVREVHRVDSKRYMFEIFMTNGKRKLLAAETADLRQEWVKHLWQAMQLSSSTVSPSRNTDLKVSEQQERVNSSMPICQDSESVMEMLPARPVSAPAPSYHIQNDSWSIASSISMSQELNSEEEPTYQNTPLHYQHHCGDSLNSSQWSSELSSTECKQEGDYDVLPLRNKRCDTSLEMEDGVYDYPISYRMADELEESADSIYDVPTSLMRIDDTTENAEAEEQSQEGIYWRI